MLRTFRDDNSSWFPLIPAQAGIAGNLGRDSRHEIPDQVGDER
ncbi:MAG: hypothetical protein AAF642_02975 [Pseudomonadota bacterium]